MKVSTFQPNMNTFQTLTLRSNCKFSFNLHSVIVSTCQKESALPDLKHIFNSCIIANSFTLYSTEISFLDIGKAHGPWQAHFALSIFVRLGPNPKLKLEVKRFGPKQNTKLTYYHHHHQTFLPVPDFTHIYIYILLSKVI